MSPWQAWFAELKYTEGWHVLLVCPLFYTRRLLYLIVLVYASDQGIFQVYFMFAVSLVLLGFYLAFQPYQSNARFIAAFVGELGVAVVFLFASLYEVTDKGGEAYRGVIIFSVVGVVVVCLCCSAYQTARAVIAILRGEGEERVEGARTNPAASMEYLEEKLSNPDNSLQENSIDSSKVVPSLNFDVDTATVR